MTDGLLPKHLKECPQLEDTPELCKTCTPHREFDGSCGRTGGVLLQLAVGHIGVCFYHPQTNLAEAPEEV